MPTLEPMSTTERVERKLAAILSADVKGYSRLMGDDEVATIRTLTTYRAVITTLITRHRGRVVDTPGDNLLAEFASVVDAVQCAVEIQRELKTHNADLPAPRRMEFRIGINLGDVIVEGERIYGDGVNIAARLEGIAEAGGICIAGNVHDQVDTKLGALGVTYEFLGEQTVKNIARPVPAYRVVLEPGVAPVPQARSEDPSLSQLPQPSAVPDKPSIAVLPFVNLSGDAEQEYFSDGITEDLITDLSKLSGLFVISRNSVFLYKGKAVKPEQMSQELGVKFILEGSVRKAGNRVRITAQLIDATTGYHLWAERYDRELQDIFAVQDEVTQKIVAALQIKLTEGEQQHFGRVPTQNFEAYECLLRGLEFYHRRTPEAHAQARQLFERAVTLDPQFAAAHAWLGRACMTEYLFQWSTDSSLMEQGALLARKAMALDESLPVAHQTLAYAYLGRKQYDPALAAARRAVALDPNGADACVTLGEILSCVGQAAEAIELVEKALRLDPHYPPSYLFALGQAYYLADRSADAIAAFQRLFTRSPDHVRGHFFLAMVYADAGQDHEARAELATCRTINPTYSPEGMRGIVPYKNQDLVEHWMENVRRLHTSA
ncbi:MAG: tetratricopeptide repeat protein [Deltaproteobacteria bacterium]|nr:tetratricopeptide repeat protein [Deltaproteobacteria bacterium]